METERWRRCGGSAQEVEIRDLASGRAVGVTEIERRLEKT